MVLPFNPRTVIPCDGASSRKSSALCATAALEPAHLETIFESITDGLVVTDAQGRVLHMNRAIRALLGIERDPLGLTLPALEALHGFFPYNAQGQPLTPAERPITRYLQGEVLTRQHNVDLILHTRDGREVRVSNSGGPIHDASGRIIGAVEVVRDVTEQRHLEQQTHQALDALLAMAESLVGLPGQRSLDFAQPPPPLPEGNPTLHEVARRLAELTCRVLGCRYVSIVALDPETDLLMPIIIVGCPPQEEQQWWASWHRPFHLAERLDLSLAAQLHAGEPVLLNPKQQPVSYWHSLYGGMISLLLPMRIGHTLVGVLRLEQENEEQMPTFTVRSALTQGVARLGALVLERERLLRERAEAQASELALREANAQMDTFLGIAGHELKTPLTSMKLTLQLAERRLRRDDQGASNGTAADAVTPFLEQLGQARQQAGRLERLINDLLDVSRVRAGKLELRLAPADLTAIVHEAVAEQRQANPARTILAAFPEERPIPISADADRIGQVVTNYLTNALKYSPSEQPVVVEIALDSQQARVLVRDEGPGLPAEEQARIWERFHRVDGIEVQSGSGIGLGLGLHICKVIVARHAGQVGVQSAPGQGSTVWFSVPLAGMPAL
jgi:signal transduction histidine kinase